MVCQVLLLWGTCAIEKELSDEWCLAKSTVLQEAFSTLAALSEMSFGRLSPSYVASYARDMHHRSISTVGCATQRVLFNCHYTLGLWGNSVVRLQGNTVSEAFVVAF